MTLEKNGKSVLTQLASPSCAWEGLWPAVMRMLSTSQSFQTFFKQNVGDPGQGQSANLNNFLPVNFFLNQETRYYILDYNKLSRS